MVQEGSVHFGLVSLPGYIDEQTEERTAHNIADVAEDCSEHRRSPVSHTIACRRQPSWCGRTVVECLEAQKVVRTFEVVVALESARVVLVLEEHELGRGQRVKDAHQHQQLVVLSTRDTTPSALHVKYYRQMGEGKR